MKHFALLIGGSLCAWMCGCVEDDDPSPVEPDGKIILLVVDESSQTFEGGKIYNYAIPTSSDSLFVENVPATDAGYIKVLYPENNDEVIYYASQIFMGNGQIIIPNPLVPANQFEHVLTADFMLMPESAIELTNIGAENVDYFWGAIQGLHVVRTSMQRADAQVYYFRQNLDGGFTDHAKWIFIIKY